MLRGYGNKPRKYLEKITQDSCIKKKKKYQANVFHVTFAL